MGATTATAAQQPTGTAEAGRPVVLGLSVVPFTQVSPQLQAAAPFGLFSQARFNSAQ